MLGAAAMPRLHRRRDPAPRDRGMIAAPMDEPGFPDLRAFLDQLRARRRPRGRRRPGRRAAGGGRDPPPRDRRRRARAALHATSRARTSRSSPTSSAPARRAELAFGRRPLRARAPRWPSWRRRCCRRRPASCGAARDVLRASCCASAPRGGARGPVTEVRHARRPPRPAARRSPAGPRTAGRSSRCPSSTPSTRTATGTTSASTACRSTTRAPPACTGRSARAAASTTRWPRRAARRCR